MTAQSVASSSADFIAYFVERLLELGVPVVTPPAGWPATWTRAVSSRRCRNLCTRLARWRRQYTWSRACAAWSAAAFRWTATRRATTCQRIWSWCGWRSRAHLHPLPHRIYRGPPEWLFAHRDLIGGLRFTRNRPCCASSSVGCSRLTVGWRIWRRLSARSSGLIVNPGKQTLG